MKSKFSTTVCHVPKLSLEHNVLSLLYILLEMGCIIKLLLITQTSLFSCSVMSNSL